MSDSRRAVRRAASPWPSWWPFAAVVVVSLLFGVFVLPRFGKSGLERHPAPDFALPVLSGGEPGSRVRLSEQRGKLVILDFWASWCGPCKAQTRELVQFKTRPEAEKVVVIGVNVSDNHAAAERYLAAVKPPWIVLEDPDDTTYAAYGLEALPTIVAIDEAGQVFAVRRRFVSVDELVAMVVAMGAS